MKRRLKSISSLIIALLMVIAILNVPAIDAKAAGTKLVAFTFDDGPYAYTSQLLDGLKARNVRATFFMVGQSGACGVAGKQEMINRMVREGHQVANHTWSHVTPFGKLSSSEMKSEVDRVYPYLKTAMGGDFKQLVRIPGGDMSSRTSSTVNYPMIRFDFNAEDYIHRDVNKTYNAIISSVKDGSIVCLHDRIKQSCDAALKAIDYLQARGYECVTISELFRRRGISLDDYKTYNSAYNKGINLPAYQKPKLQMIVSKYGEYKVIASTSDKGITLRYTTDGSIPNLSSPVCNGAITVNGNVLLRVAGFDKYGTRTEIADSVYKGGLSSSVFNADVYSGKYTDLKKTFGSDAGKLYNHFSDYGIKEGRQASLVFDVVFYKKSYADLRSAFGNDNMKYVEHFSKYGMKEGRRGSQEFDVNSYKNQYQDLRLAFGNDLTKYYDHYNRYGMYEGRKATGVTTVQNAVTKMNGVDYSLVYDYNFYVSHNHDIKKAFGNDDIATLRHFVTYGMKEGRQAKATFNVNSYKNQYPDLRTVFGKDLKSYYMHYIRYGAKEGRKGTGCNQVMGAVTKQDGVDYSAVYNYQYYVAHNPDIKKVFGNDDVATLQHFVKYGMKEGRTASADFNLAKYKSRYADLRKAFGDDNAKYYIHYISYGKKEGRNAK